MFPDPKPISIVFLDTQVFVAASFNFNTTIFQALSKHFESGRLRLLLTDITINEIKSNIDEEVKKEIVLQESFIKKARLLRSASTPEAKASVASLDPDEVSRNLYSLFETFMQTSKALNAITTNVEPGTVFEKYFAGHPPFGDATNKKSEFPDAFTIEALTTWSEDRETPMFVVSDDQLFRDACSKRPGLIAKKTIADVLDHVASDDLKRADFVRSQTLFHLAQIERYAKKTFENYDFWLDDNQEGEVTVAIHEFTLSGNPEIIELAEDYAVAHLLFDAAYTAYLDYRDPTTTVYDRETGRLVHSERSEELIVKDEVFIVEVRLALDKDNPEWSDIDDVSLITPAEGSAFQTRYANTRGYK